MQTMTRVMDYQTAEHFYAWLERSVPADEQDEVENAIHRLLRSPGCEGLLRTHTWPEMRRLAEAMVRP